MFVVACSPCWPRLLPARFVDPSLLSGWDLLAAIDQHASFSQWVKSSSASPAALWFPLSAALLQHRATTAPCTLWRVGARSRCGHTPHPVCVCAVRCGAVRVWVRRFCSSWCFCGFPSVTSLRFPSSWTVWFPCRLCSCKTDQVWDPGSFYRRSRSAKCSHQFTEKHLRFYCSI